MARIDEIVKKIDSLQDEIEKLYEEARNIETEDIKEFYEKMVSENPEMWIRRRICNNDYVYYHVTGVNKVGVQDLINREMFSDTFEIDMYVSTCDSYYIKSSVCIESDVVSIVRGTYENCNIDEVIDVISKNQEKQMSLLEKQGKQEHTNSKEDDERLRKTAVAFLKNFAEQGYENAVECIDWLEKIK